MKITLRELFLLILIVAIALGWWIDHRQQQQVIAKSAAWRNGAGFLEYVLRDRGWEVEWQFSDKIARARKGDEFYGSDIRHHEPSPDF